MALMDRLRAVDDHRDPRKRFRRAQQAEERFRQWGEERGWELHKKGWPDFLCVDERGQVICVEVKSGIASLSLAQREVFAILEAAGIKCFLSCDGKLVRHRTRRTDID